MSVRSRSRSPIKGNNDQWNDGEPRYLFIGNLPLEWRFFQVKEFLVEQYFTDLDVIEDMGHIFMLKDSIGKPKGDCLVAFDSVASCQKALKSLQGAQCQGKKLVVMTDTAFDSVECCQIALKSLQGAEGKGKKRVVMTDTGKLLPTVKPRLRTKKSQDKPSMIQKQKPYHGSQESDMDEKNKKTYGLSKEFLASLGLQPPLMCRVFVGNLAPIVTETKLREIFTLAGHVVVAIKHQNWGKVVFDHPVEAVQAISMFHGKKLYGMNMIVQFDRTKTCPPVLPEGLESVGPGLGIAGKSMRAVRMTLELQQLKEYIERQAEQKDMANLSVNTNPAPSNPLLSLLQLLQDRVDSGAATVNLAALQGIALNHNLFGNVQSQQTPPTSRFDIPPTALPLGQNPLANLNMANMNAMANAQNQLANINMANAQNPLANINMANAQNPLANINAMANAQNPLGNLQTALASLQSANIGHNQQTSQSRFDVPPALNVASNTSAMESNTSTSGSDPNWASGQNAWSNYQSPQSQSSGQISSGYGSFQHNPNEFDVQRLSELTKSEDKMKSSDMLLFTNLPPSVTSKALVNKMREVGELQFAEMTGQGRAVVRFCDERDAERCVKLYDRSKVDGQVISVKIF